MKRLQTSGCITKYLEEFHDGLINEVNLALFHAYMDTLEGLEIKGAWSKDARSGTNISKPV